MTQRKSLTQIAQMCDVRLATVMESVASLVESGALEFQGQWVDPAVSSAIESACAQHGLERLRVLKDALPPEITFDEIKLVVAKLRNDRAGRASTPRL